MAERDRAAVPKVRRSQEGGASATRCTLFVSCATTAALAIGCGKDVSEDQMLAFEARMKVLEQRVAALERGKTAADLTPNGADVTRTPTTAVAIARLDLPEWVSKGSGAFGDDEKRTISGVGAVSGIRNPALARDTAKNRARAEVSRLLDMYVSLVAKGLGPAKGRKGEVASELKSASSSVKGVEIVELWTHPTDGSIYALAQLDLTSFGNQLKSAKGTKPKVKKQLERALADAYGEMKGKGL